MSGTRILIGLAAMAVVGVAAWCTMAQAQDKQVTAGEYRLSGPYQHGNLTLFLIHGADQLKGKTYLTLGEAMEQKQVIVHETGNVNELAIENVGEQDVYIQSGDIVKGGQQDRTIAQDFIAPAHSGKIPIAAFCVEHGRWTRRGAEAADAFNANTAMLAGKELKLAARQAGDQSKVWQQVAENQQKLSDNLGVSVAAATSPSSFQLTLESPKVQETTDAYVKQLSGIINDKPDVIGYAFAINGKLNSTEVYASHELFAKLWPKLLQSSAVEALAEGTSDKPAQIKADDVATCVTDAEAGKASEKEITPRVKVITKEADKAILFETRDADHEGQCIHRSYMSR